MKRALTAATVLLLAGLAACRPNPQITPTPTRTPRPEATTPVGPGILTEAPTLMPTPTLYGRTGPDAFPPNINPLTGEVVSDPAVLNRPPLMIKISNYPGEYVRPHAGLSFADHVWEHTVEGLRVATRYTAVFLGHTPERVGSIRSGRLPDLELVPMYDGIYVASGFSSNRTAPDTPPRMGELMRDADWVARNFSYEFGYREPYTARYEQEGVPIEHTLFSVPAELWKLAAERQIGPSDTLTPGLAFDFILPVGGIPTTAAEVNYPGTAADNRWVYDTASGDWLKWTDGQPHGDVLTGQQMAFANVVIVYAEHFIADFVETEPSWYGVGVNLTGAGKAVLLRDGMRYTITWQRPAANRMIQFFDASNQVIAFKPGSTWFHLVSEDIEPPQVLFEPAGS
jgi:hypothetical protein